MKRSIPIALVFLGIAATPGAFASDTCTAPASEWQPQETLQKKLEADGWTVKRIKTEDGCYETYATDDKGRRVEAKFDPKTLQLVKMEREG